MPSPPPNGRSSTVRCRSCVKSRRSCILISTNPEVCARRTIPCANTLSKKAGKMVTMSKRILTDDRGSSPRRKYGLVSRKQEGKKQGRRSKKGLGRCDSLFALLPWACILDCPEHGLHGARPCWAEIGHAIIVPPRNWFRYLDHLQHF